MTTKAHAANENNKCQFFPNWYIGWTQNVNSSKIFWKCGQDYSKIYK